MGALGAWEWMGSVFKLKETEGPDRQCGDGRARWPGPDREVVVAVAGSRPTDAVGWICVQIRGSESVDGWEGVSNFENVAWRE